MLGKKKLRAILLGGALLYGLASIGVGELIARPARQHSPPPASQVEPITLRTSDGIDLAGSLAEPTRTSSCTVLLFHGLGKSRRTNALDLLVSHGYRVATFDLRAHGDSTGDHSSFGWDERRDVETAVRWVKAKWRAQKIAVWGHSMGAAAIAYAWTDTKTVDAIVLEALYSTIDVAWDRRVEMRIPRVLAPLAVGPRWWIQLAYHLDPNTLRPVEYLPRLAPAPIFLSTGELDLRAGPDQLAALARAAPEATTVIVPGADHVDLLDAGGSSYQAALLQFLAAHCPAS